MRRFAFGSVVAATAAVREMHIYSEQSPILVKNQKGFGFSSNVWVEEFETKRNTFPTKLKEGEKPTMVPSLKTVMKLYNLDQLKTIPEDIASEPSVPSSLSSGKPYGAKFAHELEDAKTQRNWNSNWFFTAGLVRKLNLELIDDFRLGKPHALFVNGSTTVFNADQFEDPSVIERTIVSGGSRKIYMDSPMTTAMQAYREANNFRTGLFFSEKQLKELDLMTKAEAKGYSQIMGETSFKIFNTDQIVGGAELLAQQNRAPTEDHCYLFSGHTVNTQAQITCENMSFGSKYWVSERELKKNNLELIDGAETVGVSVEIDTSRFTPVTLYNVDELENPEDGFTRAGWMLGNS